MPPLEPHAVADWRVAEVLQRWPWICDAFRRRGMICPGCAMADHVTIAEAARACGVNPEELCREIATVVAGRSTAGPADPP